MRVRYLFPLVFLVAVFSLSSCAKQDPFVGMWSWEITETPEGDFKGEMALMKDGDAYTGLFMVQGQSSPLKNVKVEDSSLSFETQAGGYYIEISSDLEESSLNGKVSAEGYEFPFKAAKISDKVSMP